LASHNSEGDLQLGPDGRWRVWHKMIGAGHQGQWVYSQAMDRWLREDIRARRVEGSGAGDGPDDEMVFNLRDPEQFREYASMYNQEFREGEGDLGQRAAEQGAPVDLKELWGKVYGEDTWPDLERRDWNGRILLGTVDMEQFAGVIKALEARLGDLSKYGFDKDADYQVIPLGDQYDSDIVISNGKVTKIDKVKPAAALKPGEYEVSAGRLRKDIGVELTGYDVLEQRTGELSAIKQRVDPSYIIDPQTMMPYFQQPDGTLKDAAVPSIDDQISMHLIEGNMDAAVTKANFRDRPTSLEYFNAAMDWARTPADIFTISAIVRGIFEPTPGPMGELRRVGAPPAWATQAWVGLQNSMGIPTENMTSTPGAEPGTVNDMTVASSSGLVPTNFVALNSAPVSLDGGKTLTTAAAAPTTDPATTAEAIVDTAPIGADASSGFVPDTPGDEWKDWAFEDMTSGMQYSDLARRLVESGAWTYDSIRETINEDLAFDEEMPARLAWLQQQLASTTAPEVIDGSEDPGTLAAVAPTPVPEWMTRFDTGEGEEIAAASQAPPVSDFTAVVAPGQTRAEDEGIDFDYGTFGADAAQAVDPASGLTVDEMIAAGREQEIRAQVGQYAIDQAVEGGGYGADDLDDIFATPGEGFMSRGQLNDPDYWARIGAEYLEDPESARIAQQVRDRQAQIEYATEFPQGQYRSEYPYTYIPGSKPEVAAGDLTPASWTTYPRPKEAGPIDTGPATPIITGEEMRRRNLGEETTTFATALAPASIVPTAAAGTSMAEPWQRARAIESITEEPFYGGIDFIPDVRVEPEQRGFMETMAGIIPFFGSSSVGGAEADIPYVEDYIEPAEWYGEGARGTRTDDRLTLVGESGPELALFPNGTEIIPLDRKMKPAQAKRLRRRGEFAKAIDSFQFGGFVGDMGPEVTDLPPGAQVMPAGVSEMLTGRPTRAPRSLFRQAGMRAPSAQTISNLIPSEIEAYQELALTKGGIGQVDFEREFRSMVPMGQGGTRQARFTPRGTGRTRYGNR